MIGGTQDGGHDMDEASLFVFVDDDTTSCIIVTNCDNDKARTMVGRALAHASAPPIKYYNADEYAAAFVAANKRRPFDMLFVGPYDDVEGDIEDIGTIYEIARRNNSICVLPVNANGDVDQEIWEFRSQVLH